MIDKCNRQQIPAKSGRSKRKEKSGEHGKEEASIYPDKKWDDVLLLQEEPDHQWEDQNHHCEKRQGVGRKE